MHFLAARLELFVDMPGDRFSLAVRVGRQIEFGNELRGFLELLDHLGLRGDHLVVRFESLLRVHAQLALGQVLDVSDARFDDVLATQVLLDRFGFGGRLDDDERFFCHLFI